MIEVMNWNDPIMMTGLFILVGLMIVVEIYIDNLINRVTVMISSGALIGLTVAQYV